MYKTAIALAMAGEIIDIVLARNGQKQPFESLLQPWKPSLLEEYQRKGDHNAYGKIFHQLRVPARRGRVSEPDRRTLCAR